MTLKGVLKEFGIPEIFQLLEQQGKTGCLFLMLESGEIEIYFQKGKIVGAIPNGQSPSEQLMEVLDKLGLVTESEKENILRQYEKELRGLPEILGQRRILETREKDLLLKGQIEELLFPVFSCKKGDFSFDQDKSLSSEWMLKEPLAVEPLILEGLRQTDEWPLLKRKIGSYLEVPQRQIFVGEARRPARLKWIYFFFKPTTKSAETDFAELEIDSLQEDNTAVSSTEKMVYNLINGKRNVEEVLRVSSLGEYSTCNALLALLDRGWIRFDKARVPEQRKASRVTRGGLGKGLVVAAGLIVLFLVISVVTHSRQFTWMQAPFGKGTVEVYRLLNVHQRARVEEAINRYKMEYGKAPDQLSDLIRKKLLSRKDLSLWGANNFSYMIESPERYRLLIISATERH